MSAQLKTPGVYIKELNAFPNSVVEVPTAIPAFIGYTEKAVNGSKPMFNIPIRITSLFEYSMHFGGAPDAKVKLTADDKGAVSIGGVDTSTQFYLFASLRLYFDNGGGPCWIVSVGSYASAKEGKKVADFTGECLAAMKKELESTMIVMPDTMLLGSGGDAYSVAQQVLAHCNDMQSRIGIFDVYGGYQKRTNLDDDVISGADGLRMKLASDFLKYGVAYYPWLYTNLIEDDQVDYSCLTADAKPLLVTYLKARAALTYPDAKDKPKLDALGPQIDLIVKEEAAAPTQEDITARKKVHNTLFTALPAYKQLMGEVKKELNILPPSGGIAGVYVRTDNNEGVQKAPANTTINSVDQPMIDINHDEQEDLNVPLNGMAVNAIRVPGRGLLIWGARTLDGNSQDWRYVNVRRAMIMLEQSIKAAAQAYVFEPNTALTWSTVKNMIINFLTQQWKAGVLMGSKPDDAFQVDVGLGSTMTGNDVLDGYMRVSVKVCMVRPAEFIEISFQQLMPTS